MENNQEKYPHESDLKAFLKERNKQLAKQSGGIAINPYNYMSKHGMGRPHVKRIQHEYIYEKEQFINEKGEEDTRYKLDEKGNKIVIGKKKIEHYI